MLIEELKKIDTTNDIKFNDSGAIFFNPHNSVFYKISFGDGTNSDSLEDGCDDYMYLTMDKYDDSGFLEEDFDGGQMDFKQEDYNGYINDEKLIRDCLDFLGCSDVDSLLLIRKISG